jgi:cytochrome b
MEPFKILILALLAAVVVSLAQGLFHLVKGQSAGTEAENAKAAAEHSRKMARALTVRIALSITLFVVIMIGWATGLISPH